MDANGIFDDDPDWTDPPNDQELLTGSPAINTGVDLTGLGITLLNSDIDGVARPSGAAWDMGAYEK